MTIDNEDDAVACLWDWHDWSGGAPVEEGSELALILIAFPGARARFETALEEETL